ncbi:MAG: hypothetical protein GY791_07010 [Alphaproteobacteria bacterium]|nr:hypothetical protein [Alphaproteobacteria bacterium]
MSGFALPGQWRIGSIAVRKITEAAIELRDHDAIVMPTGPAPLVTTATPPNYRVFRSPGTRYL